MSTRPLRVILHVLTHVRREDVCIPSMQNLAFEVGREGARSVLVILQCYVPVRRECTRLQAVSSVLISVGSKHVVAYQYADVSEKALRRLVEDVRDLVLEVLRGNCKEAVQLEDMRTVIPAQTYRAGSGGRASVCPCRQRSRHTRQRRSSSRRTPSRGDICSCSPGESRHPGARIRSAATAAQFSLYIPQYSA